MGTVYLNSESRGRGLELWPEIPCEGDGLTIAFVAPVFAGGSSRDHWEVVVTDRRHRRIATVLSGAVRRSAGVVCVEWDGRDEDGEVVPAGQYKLVVARVGGSFRLERTLHIGRSDV